MRQTPTFSMSRKMVSAIAQAAGRRGESMSAVVRDAVRAHIGLDDEDRPVRNHPFSHRDEQQGHDVAQKAH